VVSTSFAVQVARFGNNFYFRSRAAGKVVEHGFSVGKLAFLTICELSRLCNERDEFEAGLDSRSSCGVCVVRRRMIHCV
jgi:hypothetical protein